MTIEQLKTENETLRQQLEDYRQREVAALQAALADAEYRASEYRKQAEEQANLGRQIYFEQQDIITKLRSQLEAMQRFEDERNNLRGIRTGIRPSDKPSNN